ncbi:MAG: nucleotidyltransferase domain-containing protein [Pseudobutyrivibrio sp.]|nr:nucleotidyltransferase domain-containing protein [Pseudobutyrivibrio sp.]
MQYEKKKLLEEYVKELVGIYGSHLKKIILYGSYARGDNREDSDIDIMILLDMSDIEAKEFQDALSEITFNYNFDFDMDINPIAHSEETFNKWLKAYPFFKNVDKDGVILYGAA